MANQYKSIFKATTIFGSTQFLKILIDLLKNKAIALLVGAKGLGLMSIYNSSLAIFITIFGFGLYTSVVRDLTQKSEEEDVVGFAKTLKVYKYLIFIFALLGTSFVIIFSGTLSLSSFNSLEHEYDYCILSFMILFQLLAQGNQAILVSSRKNKLIACSSLFSALVSLITSVPFFYIWGIKGIVPGLVLSNVSTFLVTYCYSKKIKSLKVTINLSDFRTFGSRMLKLGMALMFAVLVGDFTNYLINLIVVKQGNFSDLGFYKAGYQMVWQSLSLIFVSMASDYYPRLVASLGDINSQNETINQQRELLLYLATPILVALMIFSPLVIFILLSSEFQLINNFLKILCIGSIFKTMSYSLGYITIAKGDTKVYFFLDGIGRNVLSLVFIFFMYKAWGLVGLAFAYVIGEVLYYLLISLWFAKRYSYVQSRENKINSLVCMVVVILVYVVSLSFHGMAYYLINLFLLLIISIFCIYKLNLKTGVLSSLKNIYNGNK